MRTGSFTLHAMLLVAVGLVGITGCDDTNNVLNPGGGGGGADIDVTSATPTSGDTNISGAGVVVQTSADTLSGTPVTRVQLDATSDGYLRQVLVYFETAGGAPRAVTYAWGVSNVTDNIVYCPAAGCTGVSVNQSTQEIFFLNTTLDNNSPVGATTKYASLSGGIQYP